MEKKILIVDHGTSETMIHKALLKAGISKDDVMIIQYGSDEAKELLDGFETTYPKVNDLVFKIQEQQHFDYNNLASMEQNYKINRKQTGGKKNKKNWKY